MAHRSQATFCELVRTDFPLYFKDCRVLDAGSLDINGSNRWLFTDCEYIGIDLDEGPNVDKIGRIHEYQDEPFDTVISTECFEHDRYWRESVAHLVNLVMPGGMFLFTCATTGRQEHGTPNQAPEASPFTLIDDYYQNLTEAHIREAMDPDEEFLHYCFYTNRGSHDLYFWGIKDA